jgi:ADP-ribose pyrophosphatase YjhB (NUDIX family)
MNFCSNCGSRVAHRTPPGDHLPRFICDSCGIIHYQNPRIVVGWSGHEAASCCKRAIEPRKGHWTVPAGFMENGESLQQGAARESYEEALADVEIGSLLSLVSILGANQVHVFFRAKLRTPSFGVGPESLEVKLVTPEQIPWDDIAFQSTTFTLQKYLADRAAGQRDQHYVLTGAGLTAPLGGAAPLTKIARFPRLSHRPSPHFTGRRRAWHNARARRLAGVAIPPRNPHDVCRYRTVHQVQVMTAWKCVRSTASMRARISSSSIPMSASTVRCASRSAPSRPFSRKKSCPPARSRSRR